MIIEQNSYYSHALGQEIIYKRYGNWGKPIIVFPSSGGSYHEYEDFKMIESISWFIENGIVQVFTPDSVDKDAFLCEWKNPHDRAVRQNQYYDFIANEFVGHIKQIFNGDPKFIATGCSMGAYHALNIFLQYPGIFDTTIALSGVYDAKYFVGQYDDFEIYKNSPTDFIWGQNDGWFMDRYREANIILACGLGRWEEQSIADMATMKQAFEQKGIPAWVDFWGHDVDHDWPWWRKQMPYYLGKLMENGKL